MPRLRQNEINNEIASMMPAGFVGIFVDIAAGEGVVLVNPTRRPWFHASLMEEIEFETPADLPTVKKRAKQILADILREDLYAVFFNSPAGDGYIVDQPTGNFRGSGHHPYTLYKEFEYSPEVPESKEAAKKAANLYLSDLFKSVG